MYSQSTYIPMHSSDRNLHYFSSQISSIAHSSTTMTEPESKERIPIPTGPQFSEAVASFLYDSLNDATKSLVVRLKNSESRSENNQGGEEHTPPGSETGSDSPRYLFDVPHARNKGFAGRDTALKELFGMWKPGAQGRIAVVGLGGIG
jgi:hypothetical protein